MLNVAAEPVVLRAWPKTLHVERGGTARLGELVAGVGERALVVCGKTVAGGPIMERLRSGLGDRLAAVFDGVLPHTPLETVRAATALFARSGADVVVSVGGGSATDTGKAIALLTGGGSFEPFRVDRDPADTAPRSALGEQTPAHVAVPTVPGAGNVMLPTAGILDEATRAKMLFDDARLVPAIGLLDAELIAFCPHELTAVTSARSIVGAIEALYSRRRNPLTNALALEAIRLMRIALPVTLAQPADLDARERSLYAALMGTLATMNAGVAAVHALGLVIGGRYGIAHGIPHAMLLPPVMRAFAAALEPVEPQLEQALAVRSGENTVDAFARLAAEAGLPMRLQAIGVERADFPDIARAAGALPIMRLSPRSVEAAEIMHWLEATW